RSSAAGFLSGWTEGNAARYGQRCPAERIERGLIRVAIVADTLSRALSLADLLAEDERLEIVEARPVSTGTNGSRTSMADVIVIAGLMRYQMPRAGPPVVAVTEMPIERDEFGDEVRAWLPIDSPGAELAAAIFAVANDLVVLTREQSKRWLSVRRTETDSVFIETLTRRELQVLRMLADGLGKKEIAQQL